MSTTEKLIADAKYLVHTVDPHLRSLYVNLTALRQLHDQLEAPYKNGLGNHPFANPLAIGEAINHSFCAARSSGDFLNIRAALLYLESLPEAAEAFAIVQPLVVRVTELEARLAAEVAAAYAAADTRKAAIERATAEAVAKIEAQFAVADLNEAPEPPKPFRGKVKLDTALA